MNTSPVQFLLTAMAFAVLTGTALSAQEGGTGLARDVTAPRVKITQAAILPPLGDSKGVTAQITATAEDDSGGPIKVELLVDDLHLSLGVRVEDPRYAGPANRLIWTWTNPPAGDHRLYATGIDGTGNIGKSDFVTLTVPGAEGDAQRKYYISKHDNWLYLDTGKAPDAKWREILFDDSQWKSGHAQLGYGDGDESTVVSFGTNAADKHITTWFRRAFSGLSLGESSPELRLRVLRDDGVVVYLNGKEVFRSNMPDGVITAETKALGSAPTEDESTHFYEVTLPAGLLLNGANVVAAEIHQVSSTSSDISFDLELSSGVTGSGGFVVTMVEPKTGERFATGSTIKLVAKARDPSSAIASLQFVIDGKSLGDAYSELCPPCFKPPCPLFPCRLPLLGEEVTFFAYWSNAPAGDHKILATAKNASGGTAESKVDTFSVGGPGAATLTFLQPKDGESFVAPARIHFECSAVDPFGSIRHVVFYANGKLIGKSDILTKDVDVPGRPRVHPFDWENVPAGRYEVVATATAASGVEVKSSPLKVVVLAPDPSLPVVMIFASDGVANELGGDDTLVFKIVRSAPVSEEIFVHFELDGTADWPTDYHRVPEPLVPEGQGGGTITVPDSSVEGRSHWRGVVQLKPGETSAFLVFKPIPDKILEGDESVVVRLVQPIPSPTARLRQTYTVGQPSEAKGIITEKPAPNKPTIVITSPKDLAEFHEPAAVDITAVAVDPAGYISRLVFLANGERIGVSEIAFIRAPDPGTPITHHFSWKNVKAGKYAIVARAEGLNGQAIDSNAVHILVKSPPEPMVVSIEAGVATTAEPVNLPHVNRPWSHGKAEDVTPAPKPATFVLSRTGDTQRPLIVYYKVTGTAINGRDYLRLDGDATIPAGQARREIEVRAFADGLLEGTESVVITLVNNPLYKLGLKTSAEIHITDANLPSGPVIVLRKPANWAGFKASADIAIEALTYDPKLYIGFAEFFANGQKIGETGLGWNECVGCGPKPGDVLTIPFTWKNAPGGEFVLIARAKDSVGNNLESAPVRITVQYPAIKSFTVRELPNNYIPGKAFEVGLSATPEMSVTSYALEEIPPRGWTVTKITEGGAWDAVTGKVKFGPFFDHIARKFAYIVSPPIDATARAEFKGSGSADGSVATTSGDRVIGAQLLHPADVFPENSAITLSELTAYATAWKNGQGWSKDPNPIPADYVTRAGALWRGGEAYIFDARVGPAPLWWVNPPKAVARLANSGSDDLPSADSKDAIDASDDSTDSNGNGRAEGIPAAAVSMAIAELSSVAGQAARLSIRVIPSTDTTAWAVEEAVGIGASVSNVSDEGTFDAARGVIRWGPFFASLPRTLSADVAGIDPAHAHGIASFDGQSRRIVHPAYLGFRLGLNDPSKPPGSEENGGTLGKGKGPHIAHLERRDDGVMQLVVIDDDADGQSVGCDLEVSDDLITWRAVHHMTGGSACETALDADADESEHRYYRVIRRP